MNVILISGGRLTEAGTRTIEGLLNELGPEVPVETMRARVLAAGIEIEAGDPARAPTIEVREVAPAQEAIFALAPHVVAVGSLTPGAAEKIARFLEGAADDRFEKILVLEPAR